MFSVSLSPSFSLPLYLTQLTEAAKCQLDTDERHEQRNLLTESLILTCPMFTVGSLLNGQFLIMYT